MRAHVVSLVDFLDRNQLAPMALVTRLPSGLTPALRRLRSLDARRIGRRRLRRVRRVLRQLRLQRAHLAYQLQDRRFQVGDPWRLLRNAPVSVVDGIDLAIKIPSRTWSTEVRGEAVNAYDPIRYAVNRIPSQRGER